MNNESHEIFYWNMHITGCIFRSPASKICGCYCVFIGFLFPTGLLLGAYCAPIGFLLRQLIGVFAGINHLWNWAALGALFWITLTFNIFALQMWNDHFVLQLSNINFLLKIDETLRDWDLRKCYVSSPLPVPGYWYQIWHQHTYPLGGPGAEFI